jgi:hypothetical protein
MVRECIRCRRPFPSIRFFTLSETRCNACHRKYCKERQKITDKKSTCGTIVKESIFQKDTMEGKKGKNLEKFYISDDTDNEGEQLLPNSEDEEIPFGEDNRYLEGRVEVTRPKVDKKKKSKKKVGETNYLPPGKNEEEYFNMVNDKSSIKQKSRKKKKKMSPKKEQLLKHFYEYISQDCESKKIDGPPVHVSFNF